MVPRRGGGGCDLGLFFRSNLGFMGTLQRDTEAWFTHGIWECVISVSVTTHEFFCSSLLVTVGQKNQRHCLGFGPGVKCLWFQIYSALVLSFTTMTSHIIVLKISLVHINKQWVTGCLWPLPVLKVKDNFQDLRRGEIDFLRLLLGFGSYQHNGHLVCAQGAGQGQISVFVSLVIILR